MLSQIQGSLIRLPSDEERNDKGRLNFVTYLLDTKSKLKSLKRIDEIHHYYEKRSFCVCP